MKLATGDHHHNHNEKIILYYIIMKDEVDGEKRREERKRQEECERLGPLNDEPSFEGRFRSDSAQGFCCCCGYYLSWGLFVSRLKQNLSLYLSSNIPLV